MYSKAQISIFDRVRIRSIPVTDERGLAGLVGQVYGETTPSVTGVEVIGDVKEDFAINVFFKNLNESYWFTREMLEFVDHAAGTEIRFEGVSKRWVRTETGEWLEEATTQEQGSDKGYHESERRKPWWEVW